MTPQAIGNAAAVKLSGMIIGMALIARTIHYGEPLGLCTILISVEVTIAAGLLPVYIRKPETGFLMIEGDIGPGRGIVANTATLSGIVILADVPFMDVGMTISALQADLAKGPLSVLFMAGNAWCGKVCPFKPE